MLGTKRRKPSRAIWLLEYSFGTAPDRVDTAAGVIYGVKIVGTESRNIGRTIGLDPREFGDAINQTYGYSPQGLRSAIPKYEGATVRIDHPKTHIDKEGKRVVEERSRSTFSTFGELRNVRMKADGLYGDLHYIKSHDNAKFVIEIAQRMPDKLALSHNAYGVPVLKGGRAIIERIVEVYSVDIVGDKPGTTNGLFESFHKPKRLKECDMDTEFAAMGEMEISDEVRTAVLDICTQEGMKDSEKLQKIVSMFSASEPVMEELVSLRSEKHARKLLEAAGIHPSETCVAAVAAMKDDASRKKLIETWRGRGHALRPQRSAPLLESAGEYDPDWVKKLKRTPQFVPHAK